MQTMSPMKSKEILFITSAMTPFVPESRAALMGRQLPQKMQELGYGVRTFSPKWGIINERRNQLHEVIRLSGMNIIIDETDHPLIIKVASVPGARMQAYFIDNDDYFMKRPMERDPQGEEYDDNGERAIFYNRGVLETVKKLRWVPSIIHCHGWLSAIAPFYIKQAYRDEPSFDGAKVIYSATARELQKDFGERTLQCLPFKGASAELLAEFTQDGFDYDDLQRLAVRYADGVILDSPNVSESVVNYAIELGKPLLPYQSEDTYQQAYGAFYEKVNP